MMTATEPQAVDLSILCWEGYDDPALLDPFAREHGVTARGETLVSDAAAVARLLSGEAARWDVINLNNPFARDVLHPRGLLRPLDRRHFDPACAGMLPQFRSLYDCALSRDGTELLGLCQRFGPFNLVINSDRIAPATAEDQGFDLANDPANAGRFAILSYDDFNVFHICIGAGLNPFEAQEEAGLAAFAATAARWYAAARLVTDDHLALNKALVAGDIDFYVSGGVYTASPARRQGHSNIRAVTPRRGPIDGKGGIAFAEVTSISSSAGDPGLAEAFLAYLLRPEVAAAVALGDTTCNPVAQMADPAVMGAFSAAELDAIQWDSLEEDIARCAAYAITPSYDALLERLTAARGGELTPASSPAGR